MRSFWSDLEKHSKSANGQILEGSGQHFGLGTFLCAKKDPKQNGFVEEFFCGGALGDST